MYQKKHWRNLKMTMKKILRDWKTFIEAKKPKEHRFDKVMKAALVSHFEFGFEEDEDEEEWEY